MSQRLWWSRSVEAHGTDGRPPVEDDSLLPRRRALEAILVTCGVAAVAAYAPEASADWELPPPLDLPPDELPEEIFLRIEPRALLDMQKQFGWSFGAATENLVFDGVAPQPFDPQALAHLVDDMRPARKRHAPFYVPTLFQAPDSLPRAIPSGDPALVVPLERELRPIFTPAMDLAYKRGRAVAALFKFVYARAALVVDLPGAEAVAFAAGASEVFDPVFLFDNWPHPRGVVAAHLTLAAAAYYQPLFAKHQAPPGAPPMFVLDRNRLAPYSDDEAGFDNRHVARLPGVDALRGMDVGHILYVVPTAADVVELDDLNEDFVHYAASSLDVRMVAADAFLPAGATTPGVDPALEDETQRSMDGSFAGPRPYFYGGSASTSRYFWVDYPWVPAAPHGGRGTGHGPPREPAFARPAAHYFPIARVSPHSSGGAPGTMAAMIRTQGTPGPVGMPVAPAPFGQVRVVISNLSNHILGAAASRSGTWGRASGTTGG